MSRTAAESVKGTVGYFVDDGAGNVGFVPAFVQYDPVTGLAVGPASVLITDTEYVALHDFTGATTGDEIIRTDQYDLSTSPATLVDTVWRNGTTGLLLAAPPSGTNLTYAGSTGLTDTQLRATAVPVSLPTTPTANLVTIAAKTTAIAAQLPTLLGDQAGAASLGVALSTEDKTALDLVGTHTAPFSYLNVDDGANTTQSATVYAGITVNRKGTIASVITVYDGTDNTGPVIQIIDSLNLSGSFPIGGSDGVTLVTGLYITATGTAKPNYTIAFK